MFLKNINKERRVVLNLKLLFIIIKTSFKCSNKKALRKKSGLVQIILLNYITTYNRCLINDNLQGSLIRCFNKEKKGDLYAKID